MLKCRGSGGVPEAVAKSRKLTELSRWRRGQQLWETRDVDGGTRFGCDLRLTSCLPAPRNFGSLDWLT